MGKFRRISLAVVLIALSSFALSGCHKISLTKGSTNSNSPVVEGDWVITFEFRDQAYDSEVTFSQKGEQLAGQGTDPSGAPFFLEHGTLKGKQVHFAKKYADGDPNKPPVTYDGELQWADVEGYKGWEMAGHYRTTSGGQVVDGKWIAVPKQIEQAAQTPEQPAQNPEQPGAAAVQIPAGREPNISGMYSASYNFNFKQIHSKLWLAQDGHQVTGHGLDTNTNEHFVITKGDYHYPRLMLVCKYEKGKSAAANRQITFKAQVNAGPRFTGETQFGGGWQAEIVR